MESKKSDKISNFTRKLGNRLNLTRIVRQLLEALGHFPLCVRHKIEVVSLAVDDFGAALFEGSGRPHGRGRERVQQHVLGVSERGQRASERGKGRNT